MKNSKLSGILRTLSKTELNQFGSFIKSPYFNNRSEVVRFFDSLKKYYPEFEINGKNLENIFGKVYPGKKFSDVLMRKLFSLTVNLIVEFLTINSFRENKLEYGIKMIDKLREKKLPQLFEKKSAQIEKLLNESIRNIVYYESRVKHTSIVNGYYLVTNEKSMIYKMQNELDDFLEYFLVFIFLTYIRLNEWSGSINIKFDLKFYKEVTNYFASRKTTEITLATLYYNMMMLLNTEDEKYYFDLIRGQDKFGKKLSSLDDYNIAVVLMQYCHKRVSKGFAGYRLHYFEIAKKLLKKNLIPEGFIDPYFFTNLVRNASQIKENKWAENFIEEYKLRLNPEIRDEIIDYSYAMTEFNRGNFGSSLNRLSKINIERSSIKLDIKNLQVMNYYELGYWLELEYLLDSYKHFLQRYSPLTQQVKDNALRFAGFVSDLLNLHHGKKQKTSSILMKEIDKTPYFGLKDWLVKKAAGLR